MSMLPPTSQERAKAEWTPSRDAYLVELLIEQQNIGMKTDNGFKKEAWRSMVADFNIKFDLQFDKGQLKNRYSFLRKQYNIVKALLDESGFSWDEARQTVTAADDVWDCYLLEHPEAKPYRTKGLPLYDQLGIICGASELGSYPISLAGQNKMHKLPPPSQERAKAEWTPHRDAYLVELLIEQQNIGTKIDNGFKKEAWRSMVADFNRKFGLQFVKGQLKNRYAFLRRQYNIVKALLDQRGFVWNEVQETVIADDDVWDNYLLEHPEAKPYRTKGLPQYDQLGIIFGVAPELRPAVACELRPCELRTHPISVAGQENIFVFPLASQDVRQEKMPVLPVTFQDVGQEKMPVLPLASQFVGQEKMSVLPPGPQERAKAEWTPSRDAYFVELLIEQQNIGKTSENAFKKEAWRSMVANFNGKFDLQFDVGQLKNRYVFLKRQYNIVKALLDQAGFGWEGTRKTVIATDAVWDRYLLAHPEAKPYRAKGLPLYDQLGIIYGGTSAEGKHQLSSIRPEIPEEGASNTSTSQSPAVSTTPLPTLEAVLEESESSSDKEIPIEDSQCDKRRSATPTTSRRNKRIRMSVGNKIADALQEMVLSSELRARQNLESKEKYSYAKCLKELQEIEDLDDTEFLKAVDVLKDEKNAIAFMSLRGPRRLTWLKLMCCTE